MSNTQSHFYWVDNPVSIMHASSPAVSHSPHALQQLQPQLGSIHSGSLRPQVLFPKKLCWYESIVQYRTALYRIVPHRTCVRVPPACPSSCPAGPVCHWQQPAAPEARCSLVPLRSAAAPLHIQTGSQGTAQHITDHDTPCEIPGPVTYRVNSVGLGACFATTPHHDDPASLV